MKRFVLLYLLSVSAWGEGFAQTKNIIDDYRLKIRQLESQQESYTKDTSLAIEYVLIARLFVDESADSLLFYQNKAAQLAQKRNFTKVLGCVEACKGIYYREQGYYDEAIKYFNNALEIWDGAHLHQIAANYSDIGTVYTYTNQYLKAIEYHKKSQQIFEKLNDINGIVDNEANIGNAFLENGFPDKALYYFKKLEKTYHLQKNRIDDIEGHKCVNYINLCTSYLRLNNYPKAKMYEDSSFHYCKRINGIAEQQYLLTELTKYFIQQKNYDLAFKYVHASDFLIGQLQSEGKLADNYFLKYQIFKGLSNADSALLFYEKFNQLNERFKKERAIEAIKLETDAKEKQIAALNSLTQAQKQYIIIAVFVLLSATIFYFYINNRQLKKKNKAISAALLEGQTTERQRLAADLHDNLGSTLSALQWSIEAINPQKLSPQEQQVYRHVQSTIAQAHDQVRLLSHNLLPDELQKQGLWKALQHLTDKLNRNTPLHWSLTLPDNPPRFAAKTEFELYSIVLELTNNILKHAQATEGKVACRVQNGECRMVVSDNGVGMADKRTNGKGMQSVESRVKSLNGTLSIDS